MFLSVLIFGESYSFDGDIWTLESVRNEDNRYMGTFWEYDINNSTWINTTPEELGLVRVIMSIGYDNPEKQFKFGISYKTTIEYSLPPFIIIVGEDGDSRLLGGRRSNNDSSFNEKRDGFYYSTIVFTLTSEDVNYLRGQNVYFEIIETSHGHSIYYGVPSKVFDISIKNTGMLSNEAAR